MKQITDTKRMLGKYLHGHKKALCCSKWGRRIVEEEPVMVTAPLCQSLLPQLRRQN